MWEMLTGIDSLVIFGTMMFFLAGILIGTMLKSWKIIVVCISLSVITFFSGKYYLDSLEWQESVEVIETDSYGQLKFSKPVKVQITWKSRKGCFFKTGNVLVLIK
jgi:hypothetical protein